MFKCCVFSSGRGILDLLPNTPALYLISDGGKLFYIGLTCSLNRRIYEHYWRNSVPIKKTSIVHWLEGCRDRNLERHLTLQIVPPYNFGKRGNKDKLIGIWEAIDFIEAEYERYYLARIDRAWDALDSDDGEVAIAAVNSIACSYDQLGLYFAEYREIRRIWEKPRQQILKLYGNARPLVIAHRTAA